MIRLHQVKEAKQVGIIYHFTQSMSILKILKDRGFKTRHHDFISFTRNYDLRGDFGEFRFVLDGDKLSEHYRVEPFLDTEYKISRGAEEREERVPWPKEKVLPVFNCILELTVLRSGWKRLLTSIQDEVSISYGNLGIPIHFVSSFTPFKR